MQLLCFPATTKKKRSAAKYPRLYGPLFLLVATNEQIEKNVTSLQSYFSSVKKDVESLEENIKTAKAIQEDVEKLSQSEDFMNKDDIVKTEANLNLKRKQVSDLEEKLVKARKIEKEIEQKQKDPNFLSKEILISTQNKIEKTKQILRNMQPMDNGREALKQKACKDLECVVCLDVPKGEVFSCTEHHILCSECKQKIVLSCPICRQNFKKKPPTRNRLAEKMIENFK